MYLLLFAFVELKYDLLHKCVWKSDFRNTIYSTNTTVLPFFHLLRGTKKLICTSLQFSRLFQILEAVS